MNERAARRAVDRAGYGHSRMYRISKGNTAEYLLGPWAHNLRICKTKGVRTFGSTAAEIVCRGATLNTQVVLVLTVCLLRVAC